MDIETDLEVVTTSLVTTNHPVPGTLKATIRAHIDSEKEQLVLLDEEMHRAQALLNEEGRHTEALLEKLRQQHTHRSTQLERYQMALAPHRDLPREILSEIFLWSLAEWGVPVPGSYTHAPWNIIRVCSLWRQLAFSMPKLWARVDFHMGGRGFFEPDYIDGVPGIIRASKNCLLSIRVDTNSDRLMRQTMAVINSDEIGRAHV